MRAFSLGNTEITNIVGYSLLPSGPLDHDEATFELRPWDYQECDLFMAELAILHNQGSESDKRLVKNKTLYTNMVEFVPYNHRAHDLDVIARYIGINNKSFLPEAVFNTPMPTLQNIDNLMMNKAIVKLPKIIEPIWYQRFGPISMITLHNPHASVEDRIGAAMAIKDKYVRKPVESIERSLRFAELVGELFKNNPDLVKTAVAAVCVSIVPGRTAELLNNFSGDTAIKRGILWALEQSK